MPHICLIFRPIYYLSNLTQFSVLWYIDRYVLETVRRD